MWASFLVVAILFLAPCSCDSLIDEPAFQQSDVQAAYLDVEETEMEGEEDDVHSEDFHDDGYEDYNDEFPRDSEWEPSDFANGERAEGEDFAENKFNDAVGTYEETDDWNLAGNSETVGGDVEKDLVDEGGESRGKHAHILS